MIYQGGFTMKKSIWKKRSKSELEQFILDTRQYFNWDEILFRNNIELDVQDLRENHVQLDTHQVILINEFMEEMAGTLERYNMSPDDSSEVKALGRFINFLYDLYSGINHN